MEGKTSDEVGILHLLKVVDHIAELAGPDPKDTQLKEIKEYCQSLRDVIEQFRNVATDPRGYNQARCRWQHGEAAGPGPGVVGPRPPGLVDGGCR